MRKRACRCGNIRVRERQPEQVAVVVTNDAASFESSHDTATPICHARPTKGHKEERRLQFSKKSIYREKRENHSR